MLVWCCTVLLQVLPDVFELQALMPQVTMLVLHPYACTAPLLDNAPAHCDEHKHGPGPPDPVSDWYCQHLQVASLESSLQSAESQHTQLKSRLQAMEGATHAGLLRRMSGASDVSVTDAEGEAGAAKFQQLKQRLVARGNQVNEKEIQCTDMRLASFLPAQACAISFVPIWISRRVPNLSDSAQSTAMSVTDECYDLTFGLI